MIGEKKARGIKAGACRKEGISTGIDCESISRISSLKDKKAFINRVFTESEYAWCMGTSDPARHLTGRFAAKEACMKALGTGFSGGIRWRDIEVVIKDDGRPGILLAGKAGALVAKDKKIFLSLSYGAGLAVAFVAIG